MSESNGRSTIHRRTFLRMLGLTTTAVAATGLLQACAGSASTPAPSKPAESKPAAPAATKPAESKPAAPAAQAAATTAPAAKTDAKPAGDAAVPSGNVTLKFWNGLTGPDGKVLEELVGNFQTKYPNIKIEQQQIPWNDLYPKLLTAIPAGEGPDMALIHTYEIPRFSEGGHITEIAPDELKAQSLDAADFYDVAWKGGEFKSKRWSLPQDVPSMGLFINNAMFKKNNLWDGDKPKAPKNMDEFLSMAKACTKGDEHGLCWGQGTAARWQWQQLLWQNGGDLFDANEQPTLDTPEAIEVTQFHLDIFKKHAISPLGITNTVDSFRTGKFGMMVQGGWNIPGLIEAKLDFTLVPIPQWFKKTVVWASSHQFVLPTPKSKDDNKRKAALAYYNWFSQNALTWSQKAGHVAARRSIVKSPEFQAVKPLVVLANQEQYWRLQPATHKIIEVETREPVALENVATGVATPEQAMKTLQEEIKRVRV
ncbi:MAG: ABC transporter substrate-binding protein [Chloroflexi bacterium]|nr:ABC transporter substrate-binding protein [Chloroflexota bacterium]